MEKVRICIFANDKPELIYQQYESIKKFVKDEDYEFIVLNNNSIFERKNKKRIQEICKELNLKYFNVRFCSFVSGGAEVKGYSLTWLFHRFLRLDSKTIHCIMEPNMFFVKDFCFNDSLKDYDIVAIKKEKENIEYLWDGFMFMRSANLKHKNKMNFAPAKIKGVETDCGGKTYYWLKANPNLNVKWIECSQNNDTFQIDFLSQN